MVMLLYCIPASQAMVPVIDPDIWWHFRTGQWIFRHGQVPVTDPFSAYGMGKPWVAYSWLFEVLVYSLFTKLGLIGILVFTVSMSLIIALVLHRALRRAGLPFTAEVFFVAIALGAMSSLLSPRSWLFSILFFTLELFIGDQRIERSVNTWSGLRGWESDPELMKARLVIGGANHALTKSNAHGLPL
jgi:hypothetical protein